jgi:DNA-binding CsgD family transcriptional regulator
MCFAGLYRYPADGTKFHLHERAEPVKRLRNSSRDRRGRAECATLYWMPGPRCERLDGRRARLVADVGAALATMPVDGPPALETHIADIRTALEVDVALTYGVLDAGDRLHLRFLHGSGGPKLDFARIRDTFGTWLHDFPGRTGWAAYNPLRPEPAQRNRVFWPSRDGDPSNFHPVARALYPRFGIAEFDQMRALICDDSTLLAWLGVFQPEPLAGWQVAALHSLVKPLRRRLIAERRLQSYDPTKLALDVLLESMGTAVFFLRHCGAVEPGNGLARAALRADRTGTLEAVRAAQRGGAGTGNYVITPLGARGTGGCLAVARTSDAPLHGAKCDAAKSRFRLTRRQTEVLGKVLQGATGKEISAALGISTSTIEKHLRKLFERTGVENRYALIARVTAL